MTDLMPIIQKPVRDMFGEAVTATEAVLLPQLRLIDPNIQGIHYLCAPPDEIIETLAEKNQTTKHQKLKYPLVALFEDISIMIGRKRGYYGTTTLNFIVATQTQEKYKSDEREEKSFVPILRPIYYEVMAQLKRLTYFAEQSVQLPHTMYERKRWGREGLYNQGGNLFADRIDAIEVQSLELTLRADGGASPKFSNVRQA